jgi:hypothetical protein
MKYIKTNHWVNKRNQEGLLFFAQVLHEALFDYSLDTYKPQALNIRLLCVEALETIDNIKSGLIKKPNIDSIVEELLWSLNSDFVAKELVGDKLKSIVERINKSRTDLKGLKNILLLLYHFFDNRKYLKKLQATLLQLVPLNRERERIYFATRLYITELINYGYTTGYLYHVTNRFFFNFSQKVSITDPDTFFEKFNFKDKTYTVVYKVSQLFNEFKSVEKTLNFKILEDYENEILEYTEKKFLKKVSSEIFIVFENIQALDDNVARLKTEILLFKIGNLFSFYHHKETPKINDSALVINNSERHAIIIKDKPIKSIIKKEDVKPKIAANKVKKLLATLNLPRDTMYRISRAIDLHSIALETEQIENKLLNLWTAIETLIPKDIECGHDRIVQIINSIVPFQTIEYINKLVEQAGSDFWYFDQFKSKKIINSVILESKEDRFTSLAALIMTAENESKRTQVYAVLNTYPLLRWRLFILNRELSNGKFAKKLIERHKQKVEWQLRRIYRVRNLIVHSGKMPSYTNILVENLHNYFDNFLNYIIDIAISENRIQAIDEAIIDCEIQYDNLIASLDKIGETPINLNNFKSIL